MAHKRQRTENGDGSAPSHVRDEFHITLANYGTIKLQKVSLEAFPSSLISVTLLEDGIRDRELYVPIGRGHESFPVLIKDIYDTGVPRHLPSKGVMFDLFVKWLKYLGLATPGRGLSTESEAAKRVSFFVETMLKTLEAKATDGHAIVPHPPRMTKRTFSGDFINMPLDIERYISDLVPFEFARRGIHVTVKELMERNVKKKDVNLSKIFELRRDGEILVRRASTISKYEPGRVTGVYELGTTQRSPFAFKHDGHEYELSWAYYLTQDRIMLNLVQLDAGCCYDGRGNLEHVIVLEHNEKTDPAAEFKRGGMVYSPDKYGQPLMGGLEHAVQFAVLHGLLAVHGRVEDAELENACLLVVECESFRFCRYFTEEADRDDKKAIPWRFELEESPEWALHT